MKKIIKDFDLYLGAITSGMMIVILMAQVFSRYVLNRAFSWSEEIALILFIMSVYFGASAAVKTNQHLRLEIILSKDNPKVRLILDLIGNAVFALFNIIILWGVIPIVLNLKARGTATAVTGIPKWTYYIVLPIMFIVMVIRLVIDSRLKISAYNQLNKKEN